jgi:hypothetical protein
MFIAHCITLYHYNLATGSNYNHNDCKIVVSSDDSMIGFPHQINIQLYCKIMYQHLGIKLEIEHYSRPGTNECFFLGSQWIDSIPSRNVDRLFSRILFGSGNIPKMDTLMLFCSRCFEILGNVGNFYEIFKTFNIPVFPKRIFRFYELMDYTTRSSLGPPSRDIRGKWVSLGDEFVNLRKLNVVWRTR